MAFESNFSGSPSMVEARLNTDMTFTTPSTMKTMPIVSYAVGQRTVTINPSPVAKTISIDSSWLARLIGKCFEAIVHAHAPVNQEQGSLASIGPPT